MPRADGEPALRRDAFRERPDQRKALRSAGYVVQQPEGDDEREALVRLGDSTLMLGIVEQVDALEPGP